MKIIEIKCDWTMGSCFDASGRNENSWSGKLCYFEENGHCIGTVLDKDKENSGIEYSHLLIGTFVPNKGMALLKVDPNGHYDPIDFCCIYEREEYNGDFFAVSYFGQHHLGKTKISMTEVKLSKEELDKMSATRKECLDRVNSIPSLGREYVGQIVATKDSGNSVKAIEQMYDKGSNK